MTRLGVTLIGSLGLALVATLVAAEVERRREPWRGYQARYQEAVRRGDDEVARRAIAGEALRPHQVEVEVTGELERCTTCHLGLEPGARTFDDHPLRGHPEADRELHERHGLSRFGCTPCHGGQGRSLDPARAHDRRLEAGGWSAFTPPRDRCGRCHAQGGDRSPRGQLGAEVYQRQACPGCHQPGRTGPGIGPDLSAVGLRGRAYLKRVLLRPDEVYPQTVMPPLRFVLDEEGEDLEGLVTYLQGMEPWPQGTPRRERRFDPRRCASCHRVSEPGGGWPPVGARHDCSFLHDEARWLRCDRCHGEPEEQTPLPLPRALTESHEGHDHAEGEHPEGPEAAVAEAEAGATEAAGAEPGAAEDAGAETPDEDEAEAEPRVLPRPPRPTVEDPAGACPVLESAFVICGVCHREGER